MSGENLFYTLERIKELEAKGKNAKEEEIIEYIEMTENPKIYSLEDLKQYHEYVRKIILNTQEVQDKLLSELNKISSPSSFEQIKEIVTRICERDIFTDNYVNR
ncbi:MAG: hypothetical protein Q8P57_01330 [Candidatus Pacearchaeota archaeon]|nr:hypothetical protein [Candidatus Pacearchaeota archaeon]